MEREKFLVLLQPVSILLKARMVAGKMYFSCLVFFARDLKIISNHLAKVNTYIEQNRKGLVYHRTVTVQLALQNRIFNVL